MSPSVEASAAIRRVAADADANSDGEGGETILIPPKQSTTARAAATSSSMTYSPPTQSQEALKALYVECLKHSLPLLSAQILRQLRQDLMGLDRIKDLVRRCLTPEEIKYELAEEEVLTALLKEEVANQVKASALGYATAQVVVQLRAVRKTDNEAAGGAQDETALQRYTSTLEILKSRPLAAPFVPSKEPFRYTPLHAFVEEEKENGCLVEDLAWENHGAKAHHKWDYRLKKSLDVLNKTFNAAAEKVDVPTLTATPLLLVESVPPATLARLIEETLAAHPTLELSSVISLPPVGKEDSSANSSDDEQPQRGKMGLDRHEEVKDDLDELAALGHKVYSQLTAQLQKVLQQADATRDWPTLEAAANGLLNTGSVSADYALKWGKALKEQQKNGDAERAYTLALTILTSGNSGTGLTNASKTGSSPASSPQKGNLAFPPTSDPSMLPTAQALRELYKATLAKARAEGEANSSEGSPPKEKYKWHPSHMHKKPNASATPQTGANTVPLGATFAFEGRRLKGAQQKAAREALLGRGQVRRSLAQSIHVPVAQAGLDGHLSPLSANQEPSTEKQDEERAFAEEARRVKANLIRLARADLQAVVDYVERGAAAGVGGGVGVGAGKKIVPGSAQASSSSPARPGQGASQAGQGASGAAADADADAEKLMAIEELLALASL